MSTGSGGGAVADGGAAVCHRAPALLALLGSGGSGPVVTGTGTQPESSKVSRVHSAGGAATARSWRARWPGVTARPRYT